MNRACILVLVMTSLAACSGSGSDLVTGSGSPGAGRAAPGSPRAPTSLSAEAMGTGIHLVWKDNADNEDGYEVERKNGASPFAKIYTVTFDTFAYHDASVAAGQSYSYRVRAVNAAGPSAYSNEVTATAPAGASPNGGSSGGPSDAGALDASVPNPTFQRDVLPILQASCGAGNSGCHIRDMYAATKDQSCRGWLSLEDAPLGSKVYGPGGGAATGCPDMPLYDRLLQLDAWETPGGALRRYVRPGDPARSYLYNKIAGGPYADKEPGVASDPMPSTAPLPAAQIELVKRWIEQGAPK